MVTESWFTIHKAGKLGFMALLLAALSACSLHSSPSLHRYGPGVTAPGTMSIVGATDTDSQNVFRTALERELSANGMNIVPLGQYIADYSLSARSAKIGIATHPVADDLGKEVEYLSKSRERKFLEVCSAMQLRATLVVFGLEDGDVRYRGTREIGFCNISDSKIEEMAAELVRDALLS